MKMAKLILLYRNIFKSVPKITDAKAKNFLQIPLCKVDFFHYFIVKYLQLKNKESIKYAENHL